MHKFLLVIVALALVVSPLRGAFALPIITAADGADHCTQMQDGSHSMAHVAGIQDVTADNSGHACDQGCGDDCCDGACNACVNGSVALSGLISVTSDIQDNSPGLTVSYGVSGRSVHPPFRPPISLS